MSADRDPIEEAADASLDLYDIATWEPRTTLDALSTSIYNWIIHITRATVILLALLILIAQFALSGFATMVNPTFGLFVVFSILPAFLIAFYVWRTDITIREPLPMLVATFLLGVLFAGFAAILNSATQPIFTVIPVIGLALFFYLIVGPIEELVKWLAIRLYVYRTDHFDAVLDGAVYGAVAGLGFATIENIVYIGNAVQTSGMNVSLIQSALPVTAARTLAGPGHVLYSAFAGYYLGLAKFNQENAGPIVVKGLLVAVFVHATYNTLMSYLPFSQLTAIIGLPTFLIFLLVILIYDGTFGYIIYRKISRYRHHYQTVNSGNDTTQRDAFTTSEPPPEPTDSDQDSSN